MNRGGGRKMEVVEQFGDKLLFDDHSLYCDEEEEVESGITFDDSGSYQQKDGIFVSQFHLLEQDLAWDDEELHTLIDKEKEAFIKMEETGALMLPRGEAVEWILKLNAHYGFSALTAILAVNYLDRFLSSHSFQRDKPWMMQLAAVACLSIAAKVEETYVPLLLDLQLEDAKYVFEAKTIQRMELLVLSSLKWRMNPVTPISFIDHIIRRFGSKTNLHRDFQTRCENLLLLILPDSRFRRYTPFTLATATMLHVIHEDAPCKATVDQKTQQFLSVLHISKEEVNKCYQLISDISSNIWCAGKRKRDTIPEPFSPTSSSSVSSSDSVLPSIYKRMRVTEQQMRLRLAIGSPP